MEKTAVKNFIKLNIAIGVITVIYVTVIISNFKYYLSNALFFDIIAIILGMSFAGTMFTWVVGISRSEHS